MTRDTERQRRLRIRDGIEILLRKYGRKAARKDKVVGDLTTDRRKEVILLAFNDLDKCGYAMHSPHDLKEKHVRALVEYWEKKALKPATIMNRISTLRVLARWIGKQGMIKESTEYVQDPSNARVHRAASEDHSWSASGIDTDAMIDLVKASDKRVGVMLQLMKAYGLRRREAVMFKPHHADQLDGVAIRVRDGTKGGRERIVMIETEEQKTALAESKKIAVSKNAHIGHPDHTLKQALTHFDYVMGKFGITRSGLGVTSHGLRHQALNDKYERIAGIPSPVRGGKKNEGDEFRKGVARIQVAEMAGHSRESISTAYLGSFLSVKRNADGEPLPGEEDKARRLKLLLSGMDASDKTLLKELLNDNDSNDSEGKDNGNDSGEIPCTSSTKTDPDSHTKSLGN